MGRLERLELENFKSYKGFHIIGPFKDFTAVVGPNGAGKSNIMDAISFVVGMTGPQLRSKNLEEFLHRSEGFKATTAHVCAVYLTADGNELRFTRYITAGLKSEYRINDAVVTYHNYLRAFEKENLLVKAKNFLVFQGDLTTIVASKPEDLTGLIEKISGSDEFKDNYNKFKEESDQAFDIVSQTISRRKSMQVEKRQFQGQKEEIERFERLREEKRQSELMLALWRLLRIDSGIETATQAIKRHKKTLKSQEVKRNQANEVATAKAKELGALTDDKLKIERKVAKKRKDVEKLREEQVTCDTRVEHLQKKVTNITDDLSKAHANADEHRAEISSHESMLQQISRSIEIYRGDAEKKATSFKLAAAELQEYNAKQASVRKKTEREHQRLEELQRQLDKDMKTRNQLQSERAELEALSSASKQKLKTSSGRLEKLDESIGKLLQELEVTRQKLAESNKNRTDLQKSIKDLEARQADIRAQMSELSYVRKQSERSKVSEDIRRRLMEQFPGQVHGRLVELCTPAAARYRVAIGEVLKTHLDSFVVDTEATARACIHELQMSQLGQGTFIPLDTIRVKEIKEKFRNQQQYPGVHLAVDLVTPNAPAFARALQYACGNTIVCDSMSVARDVCYRQNEEVKAVTLDGEVFHSNGKITGGGSVQMGRSARSWQQQDYERLRDLETENQKELETKKRALVRLPDEAELGSTEKGLETQLRSQRTGRGSEQGSSEQCERTIADCDIKLRHSDAEIEKLVRTERLLNEEILQQRNAINRVQDQEFRDFCRKINVANIRVYEETQHKERLAIFDKEVELQSAKAKRETQLQVAKEELSKVEATVKKLEREQSKEQTNLDDALSSQVDLKGKVDQANKEIRKLKEELHEAEKKVDAKSTEINHAKSAFDELKAVVDATTKELSEEEVSLQQGHTSRRALLRQYKLDKIDIPLVEGTFNDVDGDAELEQVEPDYSALPEDMHDVSSPRIETELLEKLKAQAAELDRIDPNMRALDQLTEIETRLRNVEDAFQRDRQNVKEARDRFMQVKTERTERFMNAFNHIRDEMSRIYSDLTRGTNFVHGEAHLEVEDDNEPYLKGIRLLANPSGRSTRDVADLSGGEKTVVALSLLFAMQSYRQAPFVVLDEVDAALDSSNLKQVVDYVRRKASPQFQIIQISLKSAMYERADGLVGVYRDQDQGSSGVLTLDLTQYSEV